MKILIVSSAPHAHCGIARYAVQQAEALRKEGHTVDWASTDGGTEDVRHPLNLKGRRDYLKLLAIARKYDRVVIHHQHDLYHSRLDANEIAYKNLVWSALFAQHPDVEVVVHELYYDLLAKGSIGRKVWVTERLKWSLAPKLVFHTKRELERFLGVVPEATSNTVLREHHEKFVKHADLSREQARAKLNVPAGAKVFLCVGFIQESKGFDRVVQAFREVTAPDARLYIVGSVRVEDESNARYVAMLRKMVASDPRITLVEGFVDDVTFDTWMIAANTVVLPYRNIWSSGVAARAQLFERQIIAANVGGLGDQLKPGDVLFETELELAQALDGVARGKSVPMRRARESGKGLRLAFVVPWYGQDIPGGAEAQARKTIRRLVEAGASVEVLTTCIQDYFSDWSINARRVGTEQVDGIPVRRFPVRPRDAAAFSAINEKVCRKQPISAEELQVFEREMIKCPGLIDYIAKRRADYDFFIFIPYMFATSLWGSRACPGQAVHIPCLHDEGYMDLHIYEEMLQSARGVLFNAPAERDLAIRRYGLRSDQYAMCGEGIDTDWSGDGEAFKARHQLGDYLLFIGRKDPDKNFPMLVEYFRRYRDERGADLSLVVMGPGGVQADPLDGRSIIDLGFAPNHEKRDALAGSLALCQPSVLESFSLTVMESWIARRPVLVHSNCAVTRDHCLNSGGGLYFKSYAQFAACVDRLRGDRKLAAQMGEAGRRYVHENYSWPLVIDRYIGAFRAWKEDRSLTVLSEPSPAPSDEAEPARRTEESRLA